MKKIILASLSFLVTHPYLAAQCPTANFSSPSSVCAGSAVNFVNTSTGASAYEWDFCGGDFNTAPTGADDPSSLVGPVSMNVVFDGTNWYGFIGTNTNRILRYDFGTTLSNIPTGPVDLGNPGNIITGTFFNQISFHYEPGHWYAVFAVQTANKIITLDFDSSLTNLSPTGSAFTNPLIPSYLEMQDMKVDNDSIFLFVASDGGHNILTLRYGNSMLNTPLVDTINLSAYPGPEDITLVKVCDQWYGYVVTWNNSSLLKLTFGNSLSNKPVITDLGNPSGLLFHPYSIVLAYDGMQWVAFVTNYGAGLIRVDMGTDVTNPVVSAVPLNIPGVTGTGSSLNIAKDGSAFYLFSAFHNLTKFAKIKYDAPCSAVPQTSTDSLPNIMYASSGTFHITLAASDASGNIDFHTDSFDVNYASVSDFSFANTCLGDVTSFIDFSTIDSSGSIISRYWDFGDSSIDSVPNPSHTYLVAGTYSVSLTTTANNGCTNTKVVLVSITPRPVANFSMPPACSETPIQFADSSTIASGIINGWRWDFGNGDTSLVQDPVYEFPSGGNYFVMLEVTSDGGCTDTASLSLVINYRPQSDFAVSNTCIGQSAQFTDLTSSQSTIISYDWDFGDSNTDTVDNPTHAYPAAVATYTVNFVVNAINGCADTTTRLIKINNIPTVNFTYAPLNVCEGNNSVFNDLSTVAGDTISSWFWNFGDSQTDTVQNPVHQYAAPGNYTVVLTAFSPTSCGNSDSLNISVIQSPTASFTYSAICLGNTTSFTDQSSAPTGDNIISYDWNFGDGYTDTVQNPSHTFQTSGNHLVTLTVTSNFGCTNTDSLLVVVYPLPVASFVNTNPCTINAVQFTGTSAIDTPSVITGYLWNFGNPTSGNNSSIFPNPTHTYDTTGNFVVSLITTSGFGCMDTVFSVLTVQQASDANFQYLPTCYGELVLFTNLSSPPSLDTAWFWAFDDGQFNQLENPAHFYAVPGTYYPSLTVYATNGCATTVTKPVTISPIPIAGFIYSPACISTPYHFIDSSYIASGSIVTWQWNFAGLDSSSLQNPFFTFPDTGNYLIKLTVTSDIGCSNTLTRTIHVYPLPVANFSFTPQFGNPPLNVTFTNLTTGGSTYEWNFGDNSAISAVMNPQHLYTDTNLYTIQLIAVSQYGCKDTIKKNIYVIKPILDLAITGVSSVVQDNHLQITVDLANLGTRPINDFKMEALLEGGTTIRETYVQTLPNGYAGQLIFFSKLDLGSRQAKYYCIRAIEPNGSADDVPANDELCKSLTKEFSVVNPFPNPFSDQLVLQLILPYRDQLSIELFDMIGKKITLYEGEGKEGSNLFTADLGHLADGTYAVRFRFRESQVIKTIVKIEKKK